MSARLIRTPGRPFASSVRAVPSKSVTHRALVAAALATGPSEIVGPLRSDDTHATLDGLVALGLVVDRDRDRWTVQGRGGEVPGGGRLFLGNSGTSLRFLLAVAALGRRPSTIDGDARLRERPIADLAKAIEDLGGRIDAGTTVRLPVRAGGRTFAGGAATVRGADSSQFASALLLVGSRLRRGIDLSIEPPVVSSPYVDLTLGVLRAFGVDAERVSRTSCRVSPADYAGRRFRVEGDHSAASCLLVAPVLAGGSIRIDGLVADSLQPDARLSSFLEETGCTVRRGEDWIEVEGDGRPAPFDLSVAECPDLAPALAALALFAPGRSVLRGVSHLRGKESDRVAVLERNLSAMGCPASSSSDTLEIGPIGAEPRGVEIVTASDHRIAMAFAVTGLRVPGVSVDDPDCVSKSYPGFWEDLAKLEGS